MVGPVRWSVICTANGTRSAKSKGIG